MNYSQIINETISYIERHLSEELSLEAVSQRIGFSKYHFLRIFKSETGKGLNEHIQNRRLSRAAQLLTSSNLSIIEIAFTFQFDSQEAFTRAFKREYSLPPGRYRKTFSHFIYQKEYNTMKNNLIPGWIITGSVPKSYEVSLDSDHVYRGAKSLLLRNIEQDLEEGSYCTVMQQFKAREYIGKRVRFSGYLKSETLVDWGGLWMRINSDTANIVKFDNMQDRPIKGDTDWQYYSIVLDVPENSSIINIGMLLNNTGNLWMDKISFEIVDDSVETTDVDLSSELPEGPVNLSLDNRID